jgi:hypothetical protein
MRIALFPLLCLAATAPAGAQSYAHFNPAAPENRQVLPTFSYSTVEPVLTGIGLQFQRMSADPAKPVLLVMFSPSTKALLVFGACERDGAECKSLTLQATWTRPAAATNGQLSAGIQQFNQRYSFSKALTTPDGRPALQRYLTADYGFERGNLAVNLLVFANQIDRFALEILRPMSQPR